MEQIATFFFKKIPLFLSVIFHPFIMPSLGVYIMLDSGTTLSLLSPIAQRIIMTVMLIGTIAMPLAFLPFYFFRQLTGAPLPAKKHNAPVLMTATLYYFVYFLFHAWGAPHLIQSFLFALIINACLHIIMSNHYNISTHMSGIGTVIGLIIVMIFKHNAAMLFYLMMTIFIAGLLAFARLSLNKHTSTEVYGGLASGIAITGLLLSIL